MISSRTSAARPCQQLRELAAAGYPIDFLAEETLVSHDTLSLIRAGGRSYTHIDISLAIGTAYRTLRGEDPALYGIPAQASNVARGQAARGGWTGEGSVAR